MYDLEEQTGRGDKSNVVSDKSSLKSISLEIVKKKKKINQEPQNQRQLLFPKDSTQVKGIPDTTGIRISSYISLTENSEMLF